MRGNDWTREAIEAIACSELVRASDVLNARIVKLLQPYCNCRFIWQNPAGKPSGIGGVRLRTTNENGRQPSAAAFVFTRNPVLLIYRQSRGCGLYISGSIGRGHHDRVQVTVLVVTLLRRRQTQTKRIRPVRLNCN